MDKMIEELGFKIKLEIDNYILGVQQGKKPIAFTALQTRYVSRAKKAAAYHNILTAVYDVESDSGWKVIFFYKHEYLLDIINSLPKEPKTAYEHWIVGKACGYSDLDIGNFINNLKSKGELSITKEKTICF